MSRVDVAQQRFFLRKLLVTMRTEDRLQLKVNRSQVTIQVTCKRQRDTQREQEREKGER